MHHPAVSFVIPCYRLAHLLPDCVGSVLKQTHTNFELLIMDDCSPDKTREVAGTFTDERIRYFRNDRNLGHLANYNKGIELSRGRYIWLISADDRLRLPYVLERYVQFMDNHPTVGFIGSPGIGLKNNVETGLLTCGYYGRSDKILRGSDFIRTALKKGGLLAPAVMVRRECYDNVSRFPLDMPHLGDLYLWFRWALVYDVAYLSEPMVHYRSHDLNIMKEFLRVRPEALFNDEVNVLWRIRQHCENKGEHRLAAAMRARLASLYACAASSELYGERCSHIPLTVAQCKEALKAQAADESEYVTLQGLFYGFLANKHWRHRALADARDGYMKALKANWRQPSVWAKVVALRLGLGSLVAVVKSAASQHQGTFVPNE